MRPAILGAISGGGSAALDTDVQSWLTRVASASGTVSAGTQSAVNTFVLAAKAKGYFSKFRRINLFCGDAAASLVPLVNTSGGTTDTNNSTTYAESTGRVGGGTAYLDTGYTPTQAVGGESVYLRTTQASAATVRIPVGVRNTDSSQVFRIAGNSNGEGVTTAGAVNASWGNLFTVVTPQANTTGGLVAALWHYIRTSSTSGKLYKNGVEVGSMTSAISHASPGFAFYVFANNGAGTANAFLEASSAIGAVAFDDGTMTGTHAANYYTDVQAFQTALSRQV